jgi:hypothetical protein
MTRNIPFRIRLGLRGYGKLVNKETIPLKSTKSSERTFLSCLRKYK